MFLAERGWRGWKLVRRALWTRPVKMALTVKIKISKFNNAIKCDGEPIVL